MLDRTEKTLDCSQKEALQAAMEYCEMKRMTMTTKEIESIRNLVINDGYITKRDKEDE